MASIKELKLDKIKFKQDVKKLIEITNLLGQKYRDVGRYQEAVEEHQEALEICTRIKNKIRRDELEAVTRRALGECYSEMSRHQEALNQHKLYLTLALEINDPIEIQRAHATLGRTYLLWGQETGDDDDDDGGGNGQNCTKSNNVNTTVQELLRKAETFFQNALDLCEKLMSSGKLKSRREYAEMKSRLLLNLGLVAENLKKFDHCKMLIRDSIALTKENFLLDELFRCQISMGAIHEKCHELKDAIYHYDEALKTAQSLKSKRKQFDAYTSLALACLKYDQDVKKAKHYLKKAFFLKIMVPDDQDRINHLLKVVIAIEHDLEQLSLTNELEQKITLCDKLGDHFVALKCFSLAIEYYQKELILASEADKPTEFMSKIYVSIGQTYLDDGQYHKAIEYFKHEYDFQLGNVCEQCVSLLKIADIQECLLQITKNSNEKQDLKNEIVQNYETCLSMFDREHLLSEKNSENAEIRDKLRLLCTTVKNYLNFLETNQIKNECSNKRNELKNILSDIGEINDDHFTTDSGNEGTAQTDIYDQYDLETLSNPSDSGGEEDEETPKNFYSRPKRNPKLSRNRLNQFGETPLHTACIAGNLSQVIKLVEQSIGAGGSVDINARDYCGWTPLHEAVNHGHLSIVEHLLKHGADVEARDDRSDRITPLHDACNCGHFDIIRLLLTYNADVIARDAHQDTPVECLMSWRERTRAELSQTELDECLQLENQMINLMKEKGFDLNNLAKRNKANNDNNNKSNRSDLNNKRRNLVKDLIYSSENSDQFARPVKHGDSDDDDLGGRARDEYRTTIESLRNFGSSKSKSVTWKNDQPLAPRALLNEDQEVVRDDWLIDDLGDRKKKSTTTIASIGTRKRNNECLLSTRHQDSGSSIKKRKSIDSVIDLEDDSPQSNDRIESYDDAPCTESFGDCFDFPETVCSNLTPSFAAKAVAGSVSSLLASSICQNNNNNSNKKNGTRKALTINFDDVHKSSFMVFIQAGADCKWLKEELTRRYFTHYGMKPVLALKTDNGAIVLDSDLVMDVIDNETNITAAIQSWTVDQPDKRYVELCSLESLPGGIDKTIESCLRKSYKNYYLNLNGTFFPSTSQIGLMFRALLQQTIRELDISWTNLLVDKRNYDAFKNMIVSLPNLEDLRLAGVSLPPGCLMYLINLSSGLRKLDLSYNPLGDESVYPVAQIILTYRKLEYFNLCGCDLSPRFLESNLLMNSIQNSTSIQTLCLEHNNGIPEDMIEKFKLMNKR